MIKQKKLLMIIPNEHEQITLIKRERERTTIITVIPTPFNRFRSHIS